MADPEGRVSRQAGEHDAIMTELLNLDPASQTREFGTMGLCRTWTQGRTFRGRFPMYGPEMASGRVFEHLGGFAIAPEPKL